MSSELPELVDPFRLCDAAQSFEGRLKLADLPRLANALASPDGEASYRIDCDRDERRRPRIRGVANAELTVVCQRCMGPMRLPVQVEFQLGIVTSEEQAVQLPDDYDPLLLQEENLRLASVVEDELILALPVAPLHSIDECQEDPADWSLTDIEPETVLQRENPFAVLAGLKGPNKDD